MLQALADTFGSIANDADPPIEEADLRRRLNDPTGLTYGNWDRIPLMTVEHPPPSESAVKKVASLSRPDVHARAVTERLWKNSVRLSYEQLCRQSLITFTVSTSLSLVQPRLIITTLVTEGVHFAAPPVHLPRRRIPVGPYAF
jgi:hypothetical protein